MYRFPECSSFAFDLFSLSCLSCLRVCSSVLLLCSLSLLSSACPYVWYCFLIFFLFAACFSSNYVLYRYFLSPFLLCYPTYVSPAGLVCCPASLGDGQFHHALCRKGFPQKKVPGPTASLYLENVECELCELRKEKLSSSQCTRSNFESLMLPRRIRRVVVSCAHVN